MGIFRNFILNELIIIHSFRVFIYNLWVNFIRCIREFIFYEFAFNFLVLSVHRNSSAHENFLTPSSV